MSLDALIDQDASLIKRGEIVVQAVLHRGKQGLTLFVKSVPAIEEMMQNLGSGDATDVRNWARYWIPKGNELLEVYDLADANCQGTMGQGKLQYALDRPGLPIWDPANYGQVVNLSWLRLKGLSSTGVTFTIKGLHSKKYVEEVSDKLVEACREFYIHFIKPVDIAVMVQTQDLTPRNVTHDQR